MCPVLPPAEVRAENTGITQHPSIPVAGKRCSCSRLLFCVIHRECDSRVIGASGCHVANCSWPSGLGHLLSQEEDGFVLTGVALVQEGRQMPSSCSAQVPAKRPTTSS